MTKTDRYSRQTKISGWNQQLISSSKVIIVGVGALGSIVGLNMVMAGVGEIILIDMDTIELSNLNRQILFKESDIGKNKAEVAKEALSQINPSCKIKSWPKRVQEVPISAFKPINGKTDKKNNVVLIDALDNFETRRWLNSLAVNNSLPLISGGMYGTLGNVQVIIPKETACLECQPLIPERELQKACSLPGDVRKQSKESTELNIENKIDLTDRVEISEEEYFPALGSVSSIIGGIMSHESLNLIHNSPENHPVLDKYLFIDVHHQSYLHVPLLKRKDCVVCSDSYKLKGIPFAAEKSDTLSLFKEKLSLQFNLNKSDIVISSLGRDLQDENELLMKLLQDSQIIYVLGSELPLPVKLQLSWLD
ncbi:MAG: HesA/MoeB/ThiF family protein [Candidatus Hodarchaeales archaeon]|jgi:molybdopterin/thiamine biosynthesis adenylyltransferase